MTVIGIGVINLRGIKRLVINSNNKCAYEFYISYLFKLHMCIYNSASDLESDIIRDKMDNYWYLLTEEEQDRVEEFSKILWDEFPSVNERKLKEILE